MNKVIRTKIIRPAFILILLVANFAFQEGDTCDAKALTEKTQVQLKPYIYDMSKLTHIGYKEKEWLKELEVPLFIGEKYRLVFNTESLTKQIVISIYNRAKDSKKRKLLFTTKDAPADKREFVFDYAMARQAFINYEIPAGDPTVSGGCLVFMLGYK